MTRPNPRPGCWLPVWLGLCLLTGCATLPPVPASPAVRMADDGTLLKEWLSRAPGVRTLQGVAKARVQTPERSLSATQVILVEAPDRLRTEALSPFGTPVLVMATDGRELGAMLPGDRLLYRGKPTPENLERFTRMSLRLPELVGILLYRPPMLAYRQASTWQLAPGGWRVDLETPPRRQELLFDAERRLTEVRYLYQDELLLSLVYGDFRTELDLFPGRVELALPQQGVRVSLVYSEQILDQALKPELFVLQPAEGMTVVAIDEPLPAASGEGSGEPRAEESSK